MLPSTCFSSSELQMFEILLGTLVLCMFIYSPPKFNKKFLNEFPDFVAGIVLNFDCILKPLKNFKPLFKDFLNLIDSFYRRGIVCPLTRRATLWTWIYHMVWMCVQPKYVNCTFLFTLTLPCPPAKECAQARSRGALNSSVLKLKLTVIALTDLFNVTCLGILDSITSLRTTHTKSTNSPWLNETTHMLRRAERKGKRIDCIFLYRY